MTIARRRELPILRIEGLVARSSTLEWRQLAELPEQVADLGEVAPGFVGEAIPMRVVLGVAEPRPSALWVTVISDDGHYRASIPLDEVREKGWLAYKVADEPLSRTAGGPLRVVVPQGKTLCWNVKSVAELRCTAEKEPDSVPANPRH